VGLNSLKSLNLTNGYSNKNKNNNKVKSKPLELRSRVKMFPLTKLVLRYTILVLESKAILVNFSAPPKISPLSFAVCLL
jgi:hypothetical protein